MAEGKGRRKVEVVLDDRGSAGPDGTPRAPCPTCSPRTAAAEAALIRLMELGLIDGFALVVFAGCSTVTCGGAGQDDPREPALEAVLEELEKLAPLIGGEEDDGARH